MSKELRFKPTDAEEAEILAYIAAKKKWRKPAHFLRYAVFTVMAKDRAGRHDARLGAERAEGTGGKE